jgi:hypothetical protein
MIAAINAKGEPFAAKADIINKQSHEGYIKNIMTQRNHANPFVTYSQYTYS